MENRELEPEIAVVAALIATFLESKNRAKPIQISELR